MQRPVETDPKNPKKMDRVVGQLGLLKSKIVELIRTALIYGSRVGFIGRGNNRGAGQRRLGSHAGLRVLYMRVAVQCTICTIDASHISHLADTLLGSYR